MSLFKRKLFNNKISFRESFLNEYKLDNLRKKDKMEQNQIVYKTVSNIINYINENEILKKFEDIDYENSSRQEAVKKNAMLEIEKNNYVNAYYEIWDYIEDYGDVHQGKIYKAEAKTIKELYMILKKKMEENVKDLD